MNDVNRSACSLTAFARGADAWTRGDVESDWRMLDRGQRWSKTRDELTLLIRLSFILGKIRGTLPPNIFLLPVKHLHPRPFIIKPRQLSEGEVFRGLGAIERKLKTDTRRVEASSRGRERGGGQSARHSHGENIFHAPSQFQRSPNHNQCPFAIPILGYSAAG